MPKLVVPNSAQLRIVWGLSGSSISAVNVLGLSITGSVTFDQTLANTLDAMVKAAFTSSTLNAHVHPSHTLFAAAVRDVRTADQPEYFGTGAQVAGTEPSADPLPTGIALVVSLKTARAGPSGRGRVYLTGFTEADNTTAHIASAALITAAGNFISTIRTNLGTSGLALAVLARAAERKAVTTETFHADGSVSSVVENHPARSASSAVVTSVVVRNNLWDSQRRRTSAGSGGSLFLRPLWNEDTGLTEDVA